MKSVMQGKRERRGRKNKRRERGKQPNYFATTTLVVADALEVFLDSDAPSKFHVLMLTLTVVSADVVALACERWRHHLNPQLHQALLLPQMNLDDAAAGLAVAQGFRVNCLCSNHCLQLV